MIKESKNTISRETCKKDLKHLAKADLYLDLVLFAAMLLIFVPLIFMGVHVSNYILIFGIVTIAVCVIPPVIFIYKLLNDIMTMQMINRGEFFIVKDYVCRLSKGEVVGRN